MPRRPGSAAEKPPGRADERHPHQHRLLLPLLLLHLSARLSSTATPTHTAHILTFTDEPASFSLLPPELALLVLAHTLADEPSPQSALARFVRLNRACRDLASPLLYASPCATSLHRLDCLLAAVAAGHAVDVRALRVAGRVFASKGWGVRVSKALKACASVERLELVGIDDLRAKHLVGKGGASSSLPFCPGASHSCTLVR